MQTLRELAAHPLFSLFTFVAGILVSIVLNYVFYRLALRIKQPSWAIKSNNLIRGFSTTLPSLDVKYAGRSVENLTISKVMFWNAGSQTIEGADIADADPLRIEPIGSVKILDVKLLTNNSVASRFLISTKPDLTAGFLQFDFLDSGHGAIVQVIHTGTTSSDLRVLGTIKGVGSPREEESAGTFKSTLDFLGQNIIMVILTVGCLAYAFKYYFTEGGILSTTLAIFFLGLLLAFDVSRYFTMSVPIPRGLEIYRDS